MILLVKYSTRINQQTISPTNDYANLNQESFHWAHERFKLLYEDCIQLLQSIIQSKGVFIMKKKLLAIHAFGPKAGIFILTGFFACPTVLLTSSQPASPHKPPQTSTREPRSFSFSVPSTPAVGDRSFMQQPSTAAKVQAKYQKGKFTAAERNELFKTIQASFSKKTPEEQILSIRASYIKRGVSIQNYAEDLRAIATDLQKLINELKAITSPEDAVREVLENQIDLYILKLYPATEAKNAKQMAELEQQFKHGQMDENFYEREKFRLQTHQKLMADLNQTMLDIVNKRIMQQTIQTAVSLSKDMNGLKKVLNGQTPEATAGSTAPLVQPTATPTPFTSPPQPSAFNRINQSADELPPAHISADEARKQITFNNDNHDISSFNALFWNGNRKLITLSFIVGGLFILKNIFTKKG